MTALFESITNGIITAKGYFICLIAALVCGIITALAAAYRSGAGRSFISSLIILPVIVQTVITMVNGNIGTGVAVMGAFSLVRFRSVPGKARDIVLIFLAMTAGLACAAGYIGIALLFTVFVSVAVVVSIHIPAPADKILDLRITVPETLNFTDAFEDELEKYTSYHRLFATKTCNMGSLYKLSYKITLKKGVDCKEFIDSLRVKNGNLEISVCDSAEGSETL